MTALPLCHDCAPYPGISGLESRTNAAASIMILPMLVSDTFHSASFFGTHGIIFVMESGCGY
jgi:hypothetical protein